MKHVKQFEAIVAKRFEEYYSIIYSDGKFHVTYSKVEYREQEDYYSGTLEFHIGDWDDLETRSIVENWIEYSHEKWGFDNWYTPKTTDKIKKFLRKEMKRCDLENVANKYNL
jgi:hypothetical protein